MATPAELRRGEQALARLAANDLAALWRQVSNAVEARKALDDVLPNLIRTYGEAAASLAADWYDEARAAAAVSKSFTALPASLDEQGAHALSGWAADKGTTIEEVLTLAQGGMSRRIVDWSRQTVMGSALADPSADGWQRVGVGECDFCSMLIGRGAVYSEASADFASHDHCRCSAVPAFRGEPRPVKPYTPSPRQSEADRDRAKAWIADHL